MSSENNPSNVYWYIYQLRDDSCQSYYGIRRCESTDEDLNFQGHPEEYARFEDPETVGFVKYHHPDNSTVKFEDDESVFYKFCKLVSMDRMFGVSLNDKGSVHTFKL